MYEIIKGDNLIVMKELINQGKHYDVCFTSPPYYSGNGNHHNEYTKQNGEISKEGAKYKGDVFNVDNYFLFLKERLELMLEISDYVFFNIQQNSKNKKDIIKLLYDFKDYYLYDLIWKKNRTIPNNNYFKNNFENIFVFSKNKKTINDIQKMNTQTNMCFDCPTNINNKHSDLHKAIFPIELLENCLNGLSIKTIIDPFSGLGTTGIYCIKNNIDYTGIEYNYLYVDESKKILDEYNKHYSFSQ